MDRERRGKGKRNDSERGVKRKGNGEEKDRNSRGG